MSFLKKLFGSKEQILDPIDLSVLKTDMHSHLLPGLDDGVTTLQESLEIIKELHTLGYKKLIITPHIMGDYYRNKPETIHKGLENLKAIVKEHNIDIQLEVAAEYYLDFEFEENLNKDNLLLLGEKYILVELSYINCPSNLDSIIFQIQSKGLRPVLAHPERYVFWFDNFQKLIELKERDILMQVNANSFTGYYSKQSRFIAESLVDNNMVDFIGTDAHNMRHINYLKKAQTTPYLHKLILSDKLLNKTL